MRHIFREYDIRGIFQQELNEKTVKAIGLAIAEVLEARECRNVSIGFDARLSANTIFNWLCSGVNVKNIKIFNLGLIPTPVGYFSLFFDNMFDANIMITGSHNPKEYNGFKITIKQDSFFGDDLQTLYQRVSQIIDLKINIDDNYKCINFNISPIYIDYIVQNFANINGVNKKIILDCANGATGPIVYEICNRLNLDATILYKEPDGNFPNHHPDPSEINNLSIMVDKLQKDNFDIGFGFDGDGDRIAVLTKKRVIKGDDLAYLCALNIKNPRVMGEVKCSLNMYESIDKFGKTFMSKTGHSNIKKAMKELDIDLAAEVSGHIFFKNRYFGYDDAIYAMMRVLEIVKNGIDLDKELDKLPKTFITDEIKIKVKESDKFKIIDDFKQSLQKNNIFPEILKIIDIDGVRLNFKNGWALVRASNTTDCLVMRFEAKTYEFLQEIQQKTQCLIKEIIDRL